MYKSLFLRWSPLKRIVIESIPKIYATKGNIVQQNPCRHLSVSIVSLKKRKPPEEKAIENHGGRVIRYSPKAGKEVVGIWRNMTVQDVANILNKDLDHVFKSLEFADKSSDIEYTANTVIHNPQVVRDIVKISGYRFKLVPPPDQKEKEEESKDAVPAPPSAASALRPRAPVVCVMGHVDHGKTTLLDALRDTAVVDQEFGGITQHIGAFQVKVCSSSVVTFLDTPGHAAFSAMRGRGALATDLVVLVVAADDGVMEQTVESIRMAREAQVPILVAVNKIDKPGVNIERTLRSLAQHGVVCEALGGDVQAVAVSALKRQNLDTLVEAITLQAQLMDLRADYDGYVEGVVLEAHLDPKMGRCVTVLVSRGTTRRGAVLVAGLAWAKVRALRAADGSAMDSAVPGTPAVLHGWRELPAAGDLVLEVSSEKRAHEVMRWRQAQRMKDKQEADREAIEAKSLEHQRHYRDMLAAKRARGRIRTRPDGPRQKMIQHDDHPTLSLVIKGDVDGSVEAILDLLDTYDEHNRVRVDLVHYAVGPLTPTDIEIAEAFNAVIYAFNVDCPPALEAEAKDKGIPIKHHNVIYRLVDDVKAEISNRIPPEQVDEVIGEANVLQQFYVSSGRAKLPVAGARCTKGELHKDAYYRLIRDGELIYDGKLASMKHLKEEVSVIKRDTECGLRLQSDVEVRPGDTLQCYRRTDRTPTTRWDPGF